MAERPTIESAKPPAPNRFFDIDPKSATFPFEIGAKMANVEKSLGFFEIEG